MAKVKCKIKGLTISEAEKEISKHTPISASTLRNWIKDGTIPVSAIIEDPLKRRGKGHGVRINKSWIKDFCKEYGDK